MPALLPLCVDGAWLAIEAARVVQIVGACRRARIPGAPALAPAVLAFRGRAVPAIDLGLVLGGAPAIAGDAPRSRTVIAEIAGSTLALPVDTAREVEPIDEEDLVPPPPAAARFAERAAVLDGRAVPVVDLVRVLAAAGASARSPGT